MRIAPYGSWKSPVTADLIVAETIGLGQIALDGDDVYWIESRPREAGRNVVVRRTPNGKITDVTPPPFNARTRVHEYGGGAFLVDRGTVYFSNYTDQRLYRQPVGQTPEPLTHGEDLRYADAVMDRQRNRIICVREDHTVAGREAINTIVAVPLDTAVGAPFQARPETGSRAEARSYNQIVLAAGNDFYSSPRISPDGRRLAWLTWNHPNMPWDGTELWIGEFDSRGAVVNADCVAGGTGESVFQPEWSPDGVLHFVSDRTGWWNLYRQRNNQIEPLRPMAAEFGMPQWVFGMSTYAFDGPDRIVCAYNERNHWRIGRLDTKRGSLETIKMPFTDISQVSANGRQAVFLAASATEPAAVVRLVGAPFRAQPGDGSHPEGCSYEVLRRSTNVTLDSRYVSVAKPIEFPTENGLTTHAFYYPPKNDDFAGPPGEKPPLIVMSHGGPTGSRTNKLDLTYQFWTSRGFAVVDVNYGGSTGYGRAYRERLNGNWGVVDVNDCMNAARYLVERGDVDSARLIIRGGSAGGFTTLCALTFRNVFKAGASYFGVADLEQLDKDTHKFESRYNKGLIGPYPERRDLYVARSPIHHVDRLSCPIIFFQGLEDKIVPPNQSGIMADAMRKKGLPVAYLAFEGEQHGFRRAETIKRALEAELYFYSRVFDFELADKVEPVPIDNL